MSASQSMAWKKYEIEVPALSDEDTKRKQSIHEVPIEPIEEIKKEAPVKKPPEKKKPMPAQTEVSFFLYFCGLEMHTKLCRQNHITYDLTF